MSDYVTVPFEGKAAEKATLLLAAAEELGVGQEVVQTRTGGFYVPSEVNDRAFAPRSDDEEKPRRAARKTYTPKKAQE